MPNVEKNARTYVHDFAQQKVTCIAGSVFTMLQIKYC